MSTLEQGADQGLFSVSGLIERACKLTGIDDGSVIDTPGLRALSHSLTRAGDDMNFISSRRAQRMVNDALMKRLRLASHLEREPSIRDIKIESPIFLVAPARTGTTFLHRTLAQDPAHRTLRLWEAQQAPPAEPEYRGDPQYFEKDYRVAIARKYLETRAKYTPDIASIHSTSVDEPEECYGLLETGMLSHSFIFCGPVTEYIEWLNDRDDQEWLEAYRLYADQLRLLQWWAPGERWVLKTPFHMWAVDALCETFPDALVVQQHRTPATCMASYCSLMEATYAPLALKFSRQEIGRLAFAFYRDSLARNVAARRRLGSRQFIDIDYGDLVADPIGCVRRIYEAAGVVLEAGTEKFIRTWLNEQARNRQASSRHEYTLTDYGLDEDEVNEIFAEYGKFNTPVEPA